MTSPAKTALFAGRPVERRAQFRANRSRFAPIKNFRDAVLGTATEAARNVFMPEITGHQIKRNPMVDTKRFTFAPEQDVLEIEGARKASAPAKRGLSTGSLSIEAQAPETHNPYMRIPEVERKRVPGQRTDLRKLSAWIKMMRALEEAKKNPTDEE
jgi:hypothetical protein